MVTRTITIVVNEHCFHVHEGERFAGDLCWDEMLAQVVSLTHPRLDDPQFRMFTADEMLERNARRAARLAEIEAGR